GPPRRVVRRPVAAGAARQPLKADGRGRLLIWRLLFALILRRVDAETAHRLGTAVLGAVLRPRPVRALVRRALAPRDPLLRVRALGREFPSQRGLAAGFDKDAAHVDALLALGFGFVEVGT